jgi:hypothetical protein
MACNRSEGTAAVDSIYAESLIDLAHANNTRDDFSCHRGTWADFLDLAQGEAGIARCLDLTKNDFPVFIPGKVEASWYEAGYEGAQKTYARDLKKRPPKYGDWWPNWVDSSTISQLSLLVFDIDFGITREQLKAALQGHEAVFWSTKRCTPEHPRWRVVLLLKRPFIIADHQNACRVWKRAYLEAAKRFGFNVDTNCTDLCRRWAFPVGNRTRPVIMEHLQGEPFDIHQIIHSMEEREQPKTKAPGVRGLPVDWRDVLAAIPNSERSARLVVGLGLHHATEGSDEGFATWSEWAWSAWQHHEEHEREWANFKSDHANPITWASVERLARQNSWKRMETDYAERWAITNVGGKTMLFDTTQPKLSQALMTRESFELLHQKDFFIEGKKTIYRAKEFIRTPPPETKVYPNGFCFKPGGVGEPGTFNLYRGMHVAPSSAGSCELFKQLIFDVWAGGDEQLGEWIWEYLLHLVARPGERVRTSIAIRGDGGEASRLCLPCCTRSSAT